MFDQFIKSLLAMDDMKIKDAWLDIKTNLKGCDIQNRRILILCLFYFYTTPLKIYDYFDGDYIEQSNEIALFLQHTIDDVREWLLNDKDSISNMVKLADLITTHSKDSTGCNVSNINNLNSEIEQKFIEESENHSERKIRAKVLAALDVNRIMERMSNQINKHPGMLISSYFLLLRSLVQFASYSIALDGIERQLGRKKAKSKDYTGYLSFLKRYFPDCATSASKPQNLWNQIKTIFHSPNTIIQCNYYKMSLVRVHLPGNKHPEGLRQVSPSGTEELIGFAAFSELLRSLKKGSRSLS